MKADPRNNWTVAAIGFALVLVTFAVFGQTWRFAFVNYDDDACVYDNALVAQGLTTKGIVAAFAHGHYGNWIPLTVVSHMADCQFYGLQAGGHHLTNVIIHSVSVVLLFLVLRQMTGAWWRSAFVAAVFAVHPLHVESVAWVTERKDVLSGLFFVLTLGAYVRYVRSGHSPWLYAAVVGLFALGLMAKPMLVTLPLVLLLLDHWPLNRFARCPARVLLEKIPLLLLSAAVCGVTLLMQSPVVYSLKNLALSVRMENALVSTVIYVGQLFWPAHLAAYYPYPVNGLPWFHVAGAAVILAAVTLAAIRLRRKHPYLLTGWLWYLIMLLPVIGLVQVGVQARADRYTYLPLIGLCLALTWLAGEMGQRIPRQRRVFGGGAALLLVAMTAAAYRQTACWRDSETLWRHALACSEENSLVQNNLGFALLQTGKVEAAGEHFQRALTLNPEDDLAHDNLGLALVKQGQMAAALAHFQKAVKINPDNDDAQLNLGTALFLSGQVADAVVHYQKALAVNPGNVQARQNLQAALAQKNRSVQSSP